MYGYYCENCGTVDYPIDTPVSKCIKCEHHVLSLDISKSWNNGNTITGFKDHRYFVPCGGGCGYIINQTPPISELENPFKHECYHLCCNCCRKWNNGICKISRTNPLASIS